MTQPTTHSLTYAVTDGTVFVSTPSLIAALEERARRWDETAMDADDTKTYDYATARAEGLRFLVIDIAKVQARGLRP